MADDKLMFPIGFDLEKGVREVQKDWKKYQSQMQKTVDRNPLKLKIELLSKGLNVKELKDYIALSKEVAKANKEIAKARSANALAAERESRQRVQEATELDQIKRRKTQAALVEERLTQAKQRGAYFTKKQNEGYSTQLSYIERIISRFAIIGGLYQAGSFIRNIRETTMQFELQRVALGSIIGDLNEANKMFEQIKAAAVKSPFEIKELVTYTKQLSAYKIETDELFETTQRLADISAGLGVSMDRLVLAYGQIRATGYLRGSEVRQLTEAGIPIVEALAEKMSQLRSETVSAAEVMGLISERAISFGMVKEVFDDMTSAGGMFYKMQEKQAETLAGQWSNLKDSFSIMYEEMGNTEGVNNAMKGMISLVKSLAENWRTVASVLGSVATSMGVYYAVMKNATVASKALSIAEATRLSTLRATTVYMPKFLASTKLATTLTHAYRVAVIKSAAATGLLSKAFWGLTKAMLSNPYTAILAALVGLGTLLLTTESNAKKLNKELAKIGTEGALQADQSVRNFERLAKVIRDNADGSREQVEALKEMKRAYGEFLPTQDSAIINLAREKDGYDAITQAIREKIAMQVQEQKMSAISSEYSQELLKWEGKLRKQRIFEDLGPDDFSLVVQGIKNAVDRGLISMTKSVEENAKNVKTIIENVTREPINKYESSIASAFRNTAILGEQSLAKLIETQENYNAKIKEVEDSMRASTGYFGEYTKAYQKLQDDIKGVTGEGVPYSFDWDESLTKKKIEKYNEFIANNLPKGVEFSIGETIDFKSLYDTLGDGYPQLKQIIKKIQKEYEKLIPSDLDNLIKEQFISLATNAGVSIEKIKQYFKSSETATQDWVKSLKDAKTRLSNQIFDAKKLDKDTTALEAQKQVIEAMITAWDNSEKTQKAAAKSAEQALKDELAAVEKIYKRYQDLRKLKSETDTQSILAKEFKGVSLTTLSKAYSPEQMIEVYRKALAEAQRLGKKDLVLEIQTKIGEFNVAEEQRKIEEHLDELSQKLSNTKAAKDFFDKMLGLTGDKKLTATLTMSVYGEGGEELGQRLAQETIKGFTDKYKDIDFSKEAIDEETGLFNWSKILEEGAAQKGKFGSEDYKQFLKDVEDGRKAQAKSVEQFVRELEAAKTYGEKLIRLHEETQRKIALINSEVADESARGLLTDRANKLYAKEVQKLQYEAFKDSPMYVAMFDRLDATSTTMLTNMRDQLIKMKSEWKNLDPSELKELQSRINEIDEQLSTRNPFKGIVEGIKDLNTLRKERSRKEDEQALLDATKKRLKAQKDYDNAVQQGKSNEEIAKLAQNLENCVTAEKNATEGVQEWDKATRKILQSMQGVQEVVQLIESTASAVNNVVEAFGGWGDEADKEFWDTMVNGITGLMNGVVNAGTGIARVMSGDVIGGATSIVSGIGSIISSIGDLFTAGRVRRANREIERQQELLESLERTYEKLDKATDKAFGVEYIKNYNDRLANLRAQQEAYQKQAEAEKSKGKKEDEEKTKEYLNNARETADEIADMQAELQERFAGTDLASAARDFANAWIDAYKEFGSTTDAMGEKFRDMVQNMIVESLAGRVMQQLLEPIFNAIDAYAKDGDLDEKEITQISNLASGSIERINSAMTELMDRLRASGYEIRGTSSDLSGISRDLASASEESILGLAAGINTQNFYISQVPPKLDTIISLLQGGTISTGNGVNIQDLITLQNQHLAHLPNIAQNTAETVAECKAIVIETRRTADALERVIKPRGTQSTHTLNASL